MIKIIGAVVILTLILGFIFWRVSGSKPTGPVTITYWDFWDENLIRPVLSEFEKTHPNVKIKYIAQSKLNYRTRVTTQIKEGLGPDVFPIHNSWLLMFQSGLVAADNLTISEYKSTFYPVAADSFINQNQIYAAPLGIDGLAMLVNEDILAAAGVAIPTNWPDFISASTKLTVKDSGGQIKTAGAAIGSTDNIDYWGDLLGMMLLQQQNVDLKHPDGTAGQEVVSFYTGFVTDPRKKVWDTNLESSTDMFVNGKLAFYFAPYSKAAEIKGVNPNLKFKVVPVPQLPGRQIAFGSFWGEAVSARSANPEQSWEFIKFLTSKEVSRVFAGPNARVDLAKEQQSDPLIGPYVLQGPMYKFWYLSQDGTDGGINDGITAAWKEGIAQILAGNAPGGALSGIATKTEAVLNQYQPLPSPQK
jgi:ABC-type glycerol-3-phosphate transport system substrate-binding protein